MAKTPGKCKTVMYRVSLLLGLVSAVSWSVAGPGLAAGQEPAPAASAATQVQPPAAPPAPAEDGKASPAQSVQASGEHAPTSQPTDRAGAAPHAEAAAGHPAEPSGHGSSHEAHAHDPYDLSHGNASASLASPADLRFDMSIASFVVFLILLGVLYKFAWGPIALALQQREETIARQMEEARLASERAAQQLREYQARLAAATEEARQIVAEARKDAELARDRLLAEARESAQKERDRAVAEIAVARNQALEQIAQRSVQTALALAGQILRRELRPHEHEALIGEAVQRFTRMNGS